LLNSCGD